jgi:hypothetical protein
LDSVDATVDAAEAEARRKEAAALLAKVPELKQRIAGKSIPLEVSSRFSGCQSGVGKSDY